MGYAAGIGVWRAGVVAALAAVAALAPQQARAAENKPNILVIFGDDIGLANVSAYSDGVMGYETPNIDRIAMRACVSSTITASRAARRGAPPFSPASM